MSHGCGENLVNVILPWSQLIAGLVGDVKVQRPAMCVDAEGEQEKGSITLNNIANSTAFFRLSLDRSGNLPRLLPLDNQSSKDTIEN